MANDIATHTLELVRKFSETMENLRRLQSVTTECKHVEDLQDTWALRDHFMALAEGQWHEVTTLLEKEVLPFVVDLKKGVRHVA